MNVVESTEVRFAREFLALIGAGLLAALVLLSVLGFRRRQPQVVGAAICLSAALLAWLAEAAWRVVQRASLWYRPLLVAAADRYWLRYGLAALVATTWVAVLVAGARRLPGRRRWGRALRFLAVVAATLLIFGAGAEAYLAAFYRSTSGYHDTLAHRAWERRYWRPLNQDGFRDAEWPATEASVGGRRLVFVVGDSFAAGVGIEDPGDRFSNRLGRLLGPDCLVLTMAQRGWNTGQELAYVRAFRLVPEVVVWQYFYDDLEDLARPLVASRSPILRPCGLGGDIVENSYVINFLYWRTWYGTFRGRQHMEEHWRFWTAAAGSDAVWARQAGRLEQIIEYSRSARASLVVAVFGELGDLSATAAMTNRVCAFFRDRQVPVIDMTQHLAGEDPSAFVVSASDTHPNEALHGRIADLLYPLVRAALDEGGATTRPNKEQSGRAPGNRHASAPAR